MSDEIFFSHDTSSPEDWIGRHEFDHQGTTVSMAIGNRGRLKMVDVFSRYTSGEAREFSKTVVPVRLAPCGTDHLISRSQARRVVAGLEKFSKVVFDFEGVDAIGQSFSDEIFRVFQNAHPHIQLMAINCVPDVQMFVDRVVRPGRGTELPTA